MLQTFEDPLISVTELSLSYCPTNRPQDNNRSIMIFPYDPTSVETSIDHLPILLVVLNLKNKNLMRMVK
jgi:hypothetical protein